jgi:hypothetical protein
MPPRGGTGEATGGDRPAPPRRDSNKTSGAELIITKPQRCTMGIPQSPMARARPARGLGYLLEETPWC